MRNVICERSKLHPAYSFSETSPCRLSPLLQPPYLQSQIWKGIKGGKTLLRPACEQGLRQRGLKKPFTPFSPLVFSSEKKGRTGAMEPQFLHTPPLNFIPPRSLRSLDPRPLRSAGVHFRFAQFPPDPPPLGGISLLIKIFHRLSVKTSPNEASKQPSRPNFQKIFKTATFLLIRVFNACSPLVVGRDV